MKYLLSDEIDARVAEEIYNFYDGLYKRKVIYNNDTYSISYSERGNEKIVVLVKEKVDDLKKIDVIGLRFRKLETIIEYGYISKFEGGDRKFFLNRKRRPAIKKYYCDELVEELWFENGIELNELQVEVMKEMLKEENNDWVY